jgi:hypothetical protein
VTADLSQQTCDACSKPVSSSDADGQWCVDHEAGGIEGPTFPSRDLSQQTREAREALRDALRFAFEGRQSHVAWAEHLEAHANGGCGRCTAEVVETAGDAETQREWIHKYDTIIAALKVNSAPLMIEAIAKIGDEENGKARVRAVQRALRYRADRDRLAATVDALQEALREAVREYDTLAAVCEEHFMVCNRPACRLCTGRPEWHIANISRFVTRCEDDRIRELVKAGALIAAEIDRLTRAAGASE